MRDLLFKNLTSDDRKRKILASSEIVEKEGVRSIIRRHFICIIRQIETGRSIERPGDQSHLLCQPAGLGLEGKTHPEN